MTSGKRWWRLSTRTRVALLSAAVSLVVLTAGAVWFVQTLNLRRISDADVTGRTKVDAVMSMMAASKDRRTAPKATAGLGLWEVVDGRGRLLARSDELDGQPWRPVLVRHLPSPQAVPRTITVRFDNDVMEWWAGRTVRLRVVGGLALVENDRIYAAVELGDPFGEDPIELVQKQLMLAVPLVTMLIGGVAWLAVGRALRPVAAIRAEVAEISERDLGRQVPVPTTGDELTELARTMNGMLERLGASIERERQFTANASHELRTPLASMRTQLEVALEHADRVDWRAACAGAVADLERLQGLVADLMTLSRLDGHTEQRLEAVDLADLTATHLAGRSRREPLAYSTSGLEDASERIVVRGNRKDLERLLRNLLDNAERHAAGGIGISVARKGSGCELAVWDDGPGIPEADRERVFERFVRLDEARSRDDGGAGLGLPIARAIASAHHGALTVEPSERGARLVARFPLADADPSDPAQRISA